MKIIDVSILKRSEIEEASYTALVLGVRIRTDLLAIFKVLKLTNLYRRYYSESRPRYVGRFLDTKKLRTSGLSSLNFLNSYTFF